MASIFFTIWSLRVIQQKYSTSEELPLNIIVADLVTLEALDVKIWRNKSKFLGLKLNVETIVIT